MASQGPEDTGMFLGGSSGGDMTLSTRTAETIPSVRTLCRQACCASLLQPCEAQATTFQVPVCLVASLPPPYIHADSLIESLLKQTWFHDP